MSGVSKRLHEEVAHPATSKHSIEDSSVTHNNATNSVSAQLATSKPLIEDSNVFQSKNVPAKLTQSVVVQEHHPPSATNYELTPEGRVSKIPRDEPRGDVEIRPNPIFRILSSNNDSCTGTLDSKLDPRDTKVENEKVIRLEAKGDGGNVETSSGWGTHLIKSVDNKNEAESHLNWKDPKEQPKSKNGDGVDSWRSSRIGFLGVVEGKEGSTTERNRSELHEVVMGNKVHPKCDDKFKDKDNKRKNDKHRYGEDKDMPRIENRAMLQLGNCSRELKELNKEERESERRERERKDHHKDEVRVDKDFSMKDIVNGDGKDYKMKVVDGSLRISEQESLAPENKRNKENDNLKLAAKKRERDVDTEGDRHEKRNKLHDKESEEMYIEGDEAIETEREISGNSFQQRKRMLRPRVSLQVSNREPRFRSRSRDNEVPQDKPEASTVVYKVGCMQDLMKLRKDFEESKDNKNEENSDDGPTLEVRIPAEYVTATNRQVRAGQLWGTDIYTDDSDLVAVLMHCGYCRTTFSPPSAIHEFCATIRVLPPQECYKSTQRNAVRSRAWGAGIGCSYRVEKCCIVKQGGGTINLEACDNISSMEPTLAPVVVERSMTTRAAALNALRQQRFVKEVTIQYNLCNEPWLKYSISIVADKGLKKPMYTSARLKKGEVLYVETLSKRYELCFNGEKLASSLSCHTLDTELGKSLPNIVHEQNGERSTTSMGDRETTMVDVFRWSCCKKPLPQKTIRSIGFPLPLEHVEVLEENLDWEDVLWSQNGVWIAGKEYTIARVHFMILDKK